MAITAVENRFRTELEKPEKFVITVELVLEPASYGGAIDAALAIADDAQKDGRVAAISITDNPGGNPALSPDTLGREIQEHGMDVIAHCTCRDLNRAGLESRAYQLGRLGLRNILALTGDFSATGFGGQGAPVFDLDSVTLIDLLKEVSGKVYSENPSEGFFVGCAVSPFKSRESECFLQYSKLRLKAAAGADYVITQLGYDARKFQEVLQMQRLMGIELPTLASLYVITPGAARFMGSGRVPGVVVTQRLLEQIEEEKKAGLSVEAASVERAAKLGAVLKGLGYRGLHIGGMHKSFKRIAAILDRIGEIETRWQEFLPEFDLPQDGGFYMFEKASSGTLSEEALSPRIEHGGFFQKANLQAMRMAHDLFFRFDSPLAPTYKKLAKLMDNSTAGRAIAKGIERPMKQLLFGCKGCGDCALQHTGFLCPEAGCPKHQRNGPCGGSTDGRCEVRTDHDCVWVRAYNRMAALNRTNELLQEIVPPRMWSCNDAASWLNFYLNRDHQSLPEDMAKLFRKKLPGKDTSGAAAPDEGAIGRM